MAEHPILFSSPMVRAILDGRKTQTRRVVKPQPPIHCSGPALASAKVAGAWDFGWQEDAPAKLRNLPLTCPYGVPGDRLWVRETWRPRVSANGHSRGVEYRADGRMKLSEMPSGIFNEVSGFVPLHLWAPGQHAEMKAFCDRWRPSIHMPRWASRLTLEIVSVRVERLNQISEGDAKAEGIERLKSGRGWYDPTTSKGAVHLGHYLSTAREAFEILWDSINAKKHPWDSNPWVWVVEFKRLEATDAR